MLAAEIRTERLILRKFREADVPAYAAICADAEVARFLGDGRPLTGEQVWRQIAVFLGHWELRGYGMWAATLGTDGSLIGRVGFHNPEGWPALEIGWVIVRSQWGRGFATEAARAVVPLAFEKLGEERVVSLIRPGNVASIRVAEKIGETLDGRIELDGRDTLVYGMRRGKRRGL